MHIIHFPETKMAMNGITPIADMKCTRDNSQSQTSADDHDKDSIESEDDKFDLYNISNLNRSDCDTDSLESVSVTSSIIADAQIQKQGSSNVETLTSTSGSSISTSSTVSRKSADLKHKDIDNKQTNTLNGHVVNGCRKKAPPKKLFKNKTVDFSHVKSKIDSNFKSPKDVNKPFTSADRRKSESSACILQTASESHGIRETRLSRARFEKCHETHDGPDCEGEDYLTPTQRKDNMIRDLKKEVKDLKQSLSDKITELETEKKNFEKKLELVIAEKGTEMVIVKSDMESLQQKNEDLQKSHQVSVNTINMLEETIRELKVRPP